MADLLDGRLRARLAMILGITFFPIRVEYLPGGDRYRNIRHLALYQAIEVWREPPSMSATARLRMVNVKGVPVTLRKQWASVAQECSDIRLEQVKKFKTGYWMTTWNLNDLLVAFGVGMAFHETLAADQCMLAIRNSPLGALRCAPRVPPVRSALDLHGVAPIRVRRQRTACRPIGFPTSVSERHGSSYSRGIRNPSLRCQETPAHGLDLRV
jgi:hypothetical protein